MVARRHTLDLFTGPLFQRLMTCTEGVQVSEREAYRARTQCVGSGRKLEGLIPHLHRSETGVGPGKQKTYLSTGPG